MRMYNVVVINIKTKARTQMNATPLNHDEACAMLSKLTKYPQRYEMLEEIKL